MAWLWKPSFSGGQQLTAMVIAAHTIAAASKPRQNACVDVTGEMRLWRFLCGLENGMVTSGGVCKQTRNCRNIPRQLPMRKK
jgi:hypothetical protein